MLRRELGPTALIFLLFPPTRHLHLLLDAIVHECAFLSDWGTVRPTESSSSRMGARCLLKLTTHRQRFVGIAPVCNQFARTGVLLIFLFPAVWHKLDGAESTSAWFFAADVLDSGVG